MLPAPARRSWTGTVAAVCFAVFLVVGDGVRASDADVRDGQPEAGPLHADVFVPELSSVCGRGQNLSRGCAAIRNRRILDASAAPWRAIGRVNFASTQLRQHCTGVLVADRVVATAAHCLYNFPRKAWIPAASLRFLAGYQRGDTVVTASGTAYVLDPAQDPQGRDFRGGPAQDWALIELDRPIGRQTGFLRLADSAADTTSLAGYAGLRPHVLTLAEDCGPWRVRPDLGIAVGACPAMPGDSGAPIVARQQDEVRLLGLLSSVAVDRKGVARSLFVPASRFATALQTLRSRVNR